MRQVSEHALSVLKSKSIVLKWKRVVSVLSPLSLFSRGGSHLLPAAYVLICGTEYPRQYRRLCPVCRRHMNAVLKSLVVLNMLFASGQELQLLGSQRYNNALPSHLHCYTKLDSLKHQSTSRLV